MLAPKKVTAPEKIVTDQQVLDELIRQGIDKDYVEFYQDYAPAYVNNRKVKGQSPYAKFYRDLKSNKQFMVVSQLPMVDADGKVIEVGWQAEGKRFESKNNLFLASVQGTQVEITVRNDQPDGMKEGDKLSYKPQLFLDGVEQLCGQPVLLSVDPINENYLDNTLEWDYGICKRRLRIIEGKLLGYWLFDKNSHGTIRIKYNQQGDYKLRLGRFATSDDEEQITSDQIDELVQIDGYPVTISDSSTFYPDKHTENTSVDGIVCHQQATSFATIQGGGGTSDDLNDSGINLIAWLRAYTVTWYEIIRSIILFDTAALPDNAVKTAATLSLYGTTKTDPAPWGTDICVYTSGPASNTALAAGDYDSLGTTELSNVITFNDWLVASPYWNVFTLNAAGIALVSLTNVTKFGLREHAHDAHNSDPGFVASTIARFYMYSSDKGNGYKPELIITYTLAGWTHIGKVDGVADSALGKIDGVDVATIAKISGVAV